jgi:stearoyl-CoA desaturase (delta-9 desaturase)
VETISAVYEQEQPTEVENVQPARLPNGVAKATPDAVRVQRIVALGVMLIPLIGFIEAIRLTMNGFFGGTELVLFLVMYFVHMGGVTMGLHRLLSHCTFETSTFMKVLLTIMGSMAGQGPVLYWVSTHRRHHAYSDGPGDPHSPNLFGDDWKSQLKGLWYAHMPWMLSDEVSSWGHFARDTLKDRRLFFVHQTYFLWVLLGFALPAAVGGLVHGTWMGAWAGFVFGGLARMFLANQAAWCVGSVSHMFGRRPFRTDDRSANSLWVAVVAFGEGLQNNHHAFPGSYRHAVEWWEPDLSGWVLTVMGRLGLVWNLRQPSPEAIERMRQKAATP